MAAYILAASSVTILQAKVNTNTPMVVLMKENGKTAKSMELECTSWVKELFMRESFSTGRDMERGNSHGKLSPILDHSD